MNTYNRLLLVPILLAAAVLPAQAQQAVSQTSEVVAQAATDPSGVAEEFINRLGRQQYAVAVQTYDAAVQPSVSSQSVQQYWNDLVAASGSFQSCGDGQTVSQGNEDGQTVVQVTCQFENGPRDLFVILSGDEVVSFNVAEQ